ncbi:MULTISPECIES: hypothetical protein [unclassified Tenacibaculum]|uniref:hypothetical protein n=1 Tax=unclassified Tenacibaculum TaxID=2635139 RepID=UPI001F2639B7|nr:MULTISPECIES: hypothetical protein [unclassified Tenacibaculum]MCF2875069.1 hypothetical protein [Tenacibaculum sp. Cn5-1]MCF2935145.1 hypothetical protein [Tenacibaculum sp. Cn5-34]MCG7511413.1 hypothetical protein [Tenacibaculum sp. Cn5-46]
MKTKIRKYIAGGSVKYFYNISKKGKYKGKSASIAYEDLIELLKSISELEKRVEKDIVSSADYLENKFVTDDGLQLGYYINNKKNNWFLTLDKYGTNSTIFIKDISNIKEAFKEAKIRIDSLKL